MDLPCSEFGGFHCQFQGPQSKSGKLSRQPALSAGMCGLVWPHNGGKAFLLAL